MSHTDSHQTTNFMSLSTSGALLQLFGKRNSKSIVKDRRVTDMDALFAAFVPPALFTSNCLLSRVLKSGVLPRLQSLLNTVHNEPSSHLLLCALCFLPHCSLSLYPSGNSLKAHEKL